MVTLQDVVNDFMDVERFLLAKEVDALSLGMICIE